MKKHLGLVLAAACSATIVVAPQATAESVTQERCVALVDAVSNATGAQRSAEDTERAAQEALAQAQRDVEAAEQERAASANMVRDAQRALASATKERDGAKEAVPEGVTVASASKGLEDAKAGAEAARTALEDSKGEAQTQFDRGSLGFFEAMGAEDAVAELQTDYRYPNQDPFSGQTGYRIADDTRIGAADDATHLDNMKTAIAWLPEANELRQSDGQPALPVADVLMAQAQVNINWSQQLPRGHSDNGWDNLSWNYENPFDGWFHRERPIYFEAQQQGRDPFSAGAGHYMALVNPKMRATGFAVNTEEFYHDGYPWTVAHAQTFAYDWTPETTYSVAEYTERFNAYYNGLVDAIEHGDPAKRQTLDEREAEVTDAQQILEAAYALDAAEQIVTTRTQELAAARKAQPAREAAAAEALNEAKQVATTRAQEAEAARAATAEARAKTEAAESAYQPVKQDCAKLTGADKDGSSTGGIIAGVVLGLLAIVGIVVALNPGLLSQF